jgi:hypothetical protein
MFFSPENAIADFKRKVKDLWNIPEKMYYLLINGVHESITPKSWPKCWFIQIMTKGLLGGGKSGALTIFIEGEECRCRTNQALLEILEDRDMEIEGGSLWLKEGKGIDIEEKIGVYFSAGMIVELKSSWEEHEDQGGREDSKQAWDSTEEEEETIEEETPDWPDQPNEQDEVNLTITGGNRGIGNIVRSNMLLGEIVKTFFPEKVGIWVEFKDYVGNVCQLSYSARYVKVTLDDKFPEIFPISQEGPD